MSVGRADGFLGDEVEQETSLVESCGMGTLVTFSRVASWRRSMTAQGRKETGSGVTGGLLSLRTIEAQSHNDMQQVLDAILLGTCPPNQVSRDTNTEERPQLGLCWGCSQTLSQGSGCPVGAAVTGNSSSLVPEPGCLGT